MDDKTKIIKDLIGKFQATARKYCQSETSPIRVNEDVTVSTREVHMIQAIGDSKNIGVTELARVFGTSKSAASQLVSRLAKKEFLKKRPARANNKEVRLVLTELGWEAYKAHARIHRDDMAYLEGRLQTFSLSQIAVTAVMFEALDEIMAQRLAKQIRE